MQELKELLKEKIKNLYNIYLDDIELQVPPKKDLGDFSYSPFILARELKKSPIEISNAILEELKNEDLIKEVNLAGPYLNIKVSNSIFKNLFLVALSDFLSNKDYGKGKTVVIDYIGTNVGKPLHIAHMCTPNQGQTIINLYRKLGYNVIGDSHIGDWGIIFGKLIYAFKLWGDEEKLKENAVEHLFELYVKVSKRVEDEISIRQIWDSFHIGTTQKELIKKYNPISYNIEYYKDDIYTCYLILKEYIFDQSNDNTKELLEKFPKEFKKIEINGKIINDTEEEIRKEFKKLSDGDKDSISLWQKFTRYSIDAMQIQLNRLHIKPDFDIGESFYEGLGLPKMGNYPDLTYNMKDIVKELVEKGIATKNDDGSVGVVFSDDSKMPSCILQKRDGTHGYLASDLAAVKYRMQSFNPSKIIYFVDVRQQLHLKQVFEISKMAGWLNDTTELFHAYNGFISLKDGAMSTRKGNIIRLGDLLDEAVSRAKKIILEKRQDFSPEELEKLANIIGIGAIKYGYLSKGRTTDVIFDWDEFMTFEGNSGPYIQYAYVRAFKILQKYGIIEKIYDINSFGDANFETDEENELIKELANYKNILLKTSMEYSPHILAGYSYSLTKKFNAFYNSVRILEEKDEIKKLLLIYVVRLFLEVLKESFEILGIEMPEEM